MITIQLRSTYTLFLKEMRRFTKVYHQTIISPVISTLIMLGIFSLALSSADQIDTDTIKDTKMHFTTYIGSGVIMMAILQNSFANTSSSIIMSKVIGYLADILMPPFSSLELLLAYAAAAVCRGLIVGFLIFLCIYPNCIFHIHEPLLLIFFCVGSSLFASLLGLMTGIFANSFDQSMAITNYIVNPLSLLSCTFYPLSNLPSLAQKITKLNPFFYMIDGFRYGLTGNHSSDLTIGILYIVFANLILFILLIRILNSGWRMKN